MLPGGTSVALSGFLALVFSVYVWSDDLPSPKLSGVETLGRVLFYDTHLSSNNTIACASCHLQQRAFSDPRQFSIGFDGVPAVLSAEIGSGPLG